MLVFMGTEFSPKSVKNPSRFENVELFLDSCILWGRIFLQNPSKIRQDLKNKNQQYCKNNNRF